MNFPLIACRKIAIAPWAAHDRLPGGGIIIYPAQNSSALLVGAIFLTSPFPEFVMPSANLPLLHSPIPPGQPYHIGMAVPSPYGAQNIPSTSQRTTTLRTAAHHGSGQHLDSQSHYGFIMPRNYTNNTSTPSAPGTWSAVKDEEGGDMSGFTPSLRTDTHYPQ